MTSDVRTVVTATKTSGGAAPTASVRATSFERRDGRWVRAGVHALPGIYFWKTVTGPRAVCRLEIRTEGPGARFRPRAVVQLLASPSLGCGRASTYASWSEAARHWVSGECDPKAGARAGTPLSST